MTGSLFDFIIIIGEREGKENYRPIALPPERLLHTELCHPLTISIISPPSRQMFAGINFLASSLVAFSSSCRLFTEEALDFFDKKDGYASKSHCYHMIIVQFSPVVAPTLTKTIITSLLFSPVSYSTKSTLFILGVGESTW